MSEMLPVVYLARHGETAWNLSGQHTGRTDLPLTERGDRNARALAEQLRGMAFDNVFISPVRRSASYAGCAGSKAMCWFFRTAIFCGRSPPAGSVSTSRRAGTSC